MSDDIASLGLKVDSTDIKEAEKALDGFSDQSKKTEKTTDKLEKSLESLEKQAAKTAKNIAKGIVALGVASVAAMGLIGKKAIEMGSDLEETQGKTDVVFRGMTDTVEKWSLELQDGFAMSEEESKRYLSSLQDLIVPTGMAREESGKLSNQFVRMAADLASFNNLPTQKVIEDIQSALAGGSETLTKYGINVKVANVRQEALNMGLISGKEKLSSAKRVQALYNIMMREGSDAMGDMARTSGSYANQTKQLKAHLDNILSTLGKELLPIASAVVTDINKWIKANKELMTQDIKGFVEGMIEGFKTTATWIGNITRKTNEWKNIFAKIAEEKKIEEIEFQISLLEKVVDKAEKNFWGFKRTTVEAAEAAKKKIIELRSEIGALQRSNSSFGTMATSVDDYTGSVENSIKTFEKIIPIVDKSTKFQIAQVKKIEKVVFKLSEDQIKLNIAVAKQVKDTWLTRAEDAKSVTERVIQYEKEATAAATAAAKEQQEALKVTTKEAGIFFDTMSDGTVEMTEELSSALSDFTDDLIDDGFDDISTAWESLWKGLAKTMADALTKMAVNWAASKITKIFTSYHSGSWKIKQDEELAILQKGEMVIPKTESSELRENLGSNFTGSFASLVESTKKDNPGGWDMSTTAGKSLSSELTTSFATEMLSAGVKSALGLDVSAIDVVSTNVGGVSMGLIDNAMQTAVGTLTNRDIFGASAYESLFGSVGQIGAVMGLAGMGPMGMLSTLGKAVGNIAGDLIGDLANDRSYEAARDRMESGPVDLQSIQQQVSAIDRLAELQGTTAQEQTTMGSIMGALSDMWGGIKGFLGLSNLPTNIYTPSPEKMKEKAEKNKGYLDALDSWSKETQDSWNLATRQTLDAWGFSKALGYDPIDNTYNQDPDSSGGWGEDTDTEADKTDSDTGTSGGHGGLGSGQGPDVDAEQNDPGGGGNEAGGGGGGDTESEAGGRGGVHGGMDYIPKETTYMLDRGERVLSPRQNRDLTGYLSRQRGMSGGSVVTLLQQILSSLVSGNQSVAKNTLKSLNIMNKWDNEGLPEERA